MDNQHRKISGYRDLDHDEIDLINEIKALENRVGALLSRVGEHLERQRTLASQGREDRERIANAEPGRWMATARTDLQVGFMKLNRAVAQPISTL